MGFLIALRTDTELPTLIHVHNRLVVDEERTDHDAATSTVLVLDDTQ